MNIFQERLNELLRFTEMRQKDFADLIGVSRQSLGAYLKGTNVPDANTIRKICETNLISADWLLGLSDIQFPDIDFRTACEKFHLSGKAGKTLFRFRSEELSSFFELDENEFWDEFIAAYHHYLTYSKDIDDPFPTIEIKDEEIVLNKLGSVKFISRQMGDLLTNALYNKVFEEVKKNGKR